MSYSLQQEERQTLTALNLHSAVLSVQRVVVEVHHTGQRGGEPHPVGDGPVAVEPHHLVLLRDVVQETEVETQSISGLTPS